MNYDDGAKQSMNTLAGSRPVAETHLDEPYAYEIRWRSGLRSSVRLHSTAQTATAARLSVEREARRQGYAPRRWWQLWRHDDFSGFVPSGAVRELFAHAAQQLRERGWKPDPSRARSHTLLGMIDARHGYAHPITHAARLCFHSRTGDAISIWELERQRTQAEVLALLDELAREP